jgi:hypothetical protein
MRTEIDLVRGGGSLSTSMDLYQRCGAGIDLYATGQWTNPLISDVAEIAVPQSPPEGEA